MSVLIPIALSVLAAIFGWFAGRRWERGRIELERMAYEDEVARRAVRSGSIRMSTMKIRR